MKNIFVLSTILIFSLKATALECDDSTEALLGYQKQILSAAHSTSNSEQFLQRSAEPLRCLLQIYSHSDGVTKFLAGSCLKPLWGGPEHKLLRKDKNYDKALKAFFEKSLNDPDLLKQSELTAFADADWGDYQNFCQGSVSENMCLELLPDAGHIRAQSEMLGASSLLVLRHAYRQFSGKNKKQVATLIARLYRDIPREDRLKRRVIEEIYLEIFPSSRLQLKLS